jgi:purine nucleosidase
MIGAPIVGAATPQPSSSSIGVPDVIVDTDVDFDDAAALAYLAEANRLGLIRLRAVTVSISGFAPAGEGLSHTRCLFRKLQLDGVPVSDGDRLGIHPFPTQLHDLIVPIVEQAVEPSTSTPCPTVPTEGGAARLLVSSILPAPGSVTIVTLGPVTNLGEALEREPTIAAGIGRVVIQGGVTQYSGQPGVDLNIWADAPAVQTVFAALSGRIYLTGVTATDLVPLSAAFRQRVATDRTTAAANIVYTIASAHLLMSGEAEQLNPPGRAYWWDPLTAVAASSEDVVTYVTTPASVLLSGPLEGRIAVAPGGTTVRFGVWARAERFHAIFLAVLNGRLPFEG